MTDLDLSPLPGRVRIQCVVRPAASLTLSARASRFRGCARAAPAALIRPADHTRVWWRMDGPHAARWCLAPVPAGDIYPVAPTRARIVQGSRRTKHQAPAARVERGWSGQACQ